MSSHIWIIIVSSESYYSFLSTFITIIIFKDFLHLFLERGEGREKERERNIDVWEKYRSAASCMPPTGDLARNPGMCPDWESNQWPFSLLDDAQPTEPHQSGLLPLSWLNFTEAFWGRESIVSVVHKKKWRSRELSDLLRRSHSYYTAEAEFLRSHRATSSGDTAYPDSTVYDITTDTGWLRFNHFFVKLHYNPANYLLSLLLYKQESRGSESWALCPRVLSQLEAEAGFEPSSAWLQNPPSCPLSFIGSLALPGKI